MINKHSHFAGRKAFSAGPLGLIGSNLARRLTELGARLQQFPLFRLTVVRFGIVALLGQGVYFILYGLLFVLTGSTAVTLAIAGGICILGSAYIHARVTFRVQFSWRLLVGYLHIQLLGFAISFISGLALDHAGASQWLIAMITSALWAVISFALTWVLYRAGNQKDQGTDAPVRSGKD
jgi:hypothetical protein